jgi:hypothetical protein
VAIAHRHSEPETPSKIVADSSRRDLRPGICAGCVFWESADGRVGLGALFSIAGPVLSLSSALFLLRISGRADAGQFHE